ncbi:MAG TPA: hypothetical protein VFN78_11615 [Ktedonobacterales bacterium]|nr:hypothetical protein [Ktedonobacterales bacterium]
MWRRTIATGLTLAALTLALAACGSTGGAGGAGGGPTPTATATPIPACTTWKIITSPAATQYAQSHLAGVSALSPTDAWAVGMNTAGEGNNLAASLIERWDGSAWRLVTNPGAAFLNGVAAVSAQDVWAVGVEPSTVSSGSQILIEHWNGTQWSVVPAPIPGQTNSGLNSVAAQTAKSVWAAGYFNGLGYNPQPLIERWDGSAWRVVSSPLLANATAGSFSALGSIPGSSQLWAVGSVRYGAPPSTGGIGYFQPLIERWNGSAWQASASPTLPSGALAGALKGVVALSATDAWAVGNYTASDHTIRALIAHWNGTSWTVASSPDEWGELAGVAAVGARDVRAVGYHMTGAEGSAPIGIVEQWNGAAWSVSESPTPQGVTHSSLDAIATDGAGGYWAVGAYPNADSISQALIARCA